MKVLLLASLCLLATPSLAAEIHFAPRENLEAIDLELLASARSKIDIAVYGFTSTKVMDALAEAAARGVHVRLYRDRSQVRRRGKAAEAAEALARTTNVEVRIKQRGPLMHLKAYAVDGIVLRSGSANFTRSGLRRQDNDLIVDRDPDDVKAFEIDFNDMWER
jgi:phosphatidylserine/phosphatidylglycerophosphate/cardiolipin synthase-like enzyme